MDRIARSVQRKEKSGSVINKEENFMIISRKLMIKKKHCAKI